MKLLQHLFENNKNWADKTKQADPDFFNKLSKQQSPEYLWIGCSDSRVSANEITGMLPGEIFVHRNIANLVVHSDLNCLSVLQYAVYVLKVKHIIVCGHYGCGGIKAAMDNKSHGLIDNWLGHIKDVYRYHEHEVKQVKDQEKKFDIMCELNIREQVINVCNTTIVQTAWESGQDLAVHGWIYSIKDGILRDLDICITGPEQVPLTHRIE